jgi:hypothetical protein
MRLIDDQLRHQPSLQPNRGSIDILKTHEAVELVIIEEMA